MMAIDRRRTRSEWGRFVTDCAGNKCRINEKIRYAGTRGTPIGSAQMENPKATRRLIKHKGIGCNDSKEQMGLYQGTKKIAQMRQGH